MHGGRGAIRVLASCIGASLVAVGALLIAAQIMIVAYHPYLIDHLSKILDIEPYNLAAKANELGFGVQLIGAFLMLASAFGGSNLK